MLGCWSSAILLLPWPSSTASPSQSSCRVCLLLLAKSCRRVFSNCGCASWLHGDPSGELTLIRVSPICTGLMGSLLHCGKQLGWGIVSTLLHKTTPCCSSCSIVAICACASASSCCFFRKHAASSSAARRCLLFNCMLGDASLPCSAAAAASAAACSAKSWPILLACGAS